MSKSSSQKILHERLRIGDLLMQLGLTSEEAIAWAYAVHKESGKQIGAVLVDAGECTNEDLSYALDLQKRLRDRRTTVSALDELQDAQKKRVVSACRKLANEDDTDPTLVSA
jgi:hypothetical protein